MLQSTEKRTYSVYSMQRPVRAEGGPREENGLGEGGTGHVLSRLTCVLLVLASVRFRRWW